jgi:hypothetical protein
MPIRSSVAQSYKHLILLQRYIYIYMGARGSVVVKALSYKSEGRGIASR